MCIPSPPHSVCNLNWLVRNDHAITTVTVTVLTLTVLAVNIMSNMIEILYEQQVYVIDYGG
jgi:hypothetical protein